VDKHFHHTKACFLAVDSVLAEDMLIQTLFQV